MTTNLDDLVEAEVRRLVESAPPAPALDEFATPRRARSQHRRHNALLTAGVAALVIVVALGATVIFGGTHSSPTTKDARGQLSTTSTTVPPSRLSSLPRAELPGWRFVDQTVENGAPGEVRGSPGRIGYLAILRSQGDPFGGPQIWVGTYEGELRYPMNGITAGPPSGRSIGPNAQPLDVNGVSALLSTVVVPQTGEHRTGVIWNPDPSFTIFVWGIRAAEPDVVAVARALTLAPDAQSATLKSIPAGLVATPLDALMATSTNVVRYRFEQGDREVTMTVVAGSRQRLEMDLFGMTDLEPVTLQNGVGYLSTLPGPQARPSLTAWIDGAWIVHLSDTSSSAQPLDLAGLAEHLHIN